MLSGRNVSLTPVVLGPFNWRFKCLESFSTTCVSSSSGLGGRMSPEDLCRSCTVSLDADGGGGRGGGKSLGTLCPISMAGPGKEWWVLIPR